jgi:hypothetical protein
MASQTSPIKALGQIENLSFYRQEGCYRARRKTGVDTKRYYHDPSYANTRASLGQVWKGQYPGFPGVPLRAAWL